MNPDRSWMYKRIVNGLLNSEFVEGIERFAEYAQLNSLHRSEGRFKCPCKKCKNCRYHDMDDIKFHLVSKGFEPNYFVWTLHGETKEQPSSSHHQDYHANPAHDFRGEASCDVPPPESTNTFMDMVQDAAGPYFNVDDSTEEPPNAEAKLFYDMVNAGKKPLYPGCEGHTQFGDAYGKKQNEYRQFVAQRGKLHPGCDDPSIWRAWSTEWERPENVAKSQQSSRNRRSEPEGPMTGMSRHTGGSRSSIDHADDLSRSLRRPPSLYEVFVRTHQKPGGTFVDKRSQNMNDEYLRRLEVAAASSPNDVDPDEVWKEVVGSKKNRTYGVGSLGKLESQGSSSRSSSSSQNEEVVRLREAFDQMQQRQMTLEADINNRVQQQVQAALAVFMANFQPPPPPPTS